MFFVISGFVMYAATADGPQLPDWRWFGIRRALRILPMYWLATALNVAVLLVLPSAVLHSTLDGETVLKSILLIPDFNESGRVEPLVGVGWTLYFESLFYVVVTISLMLKVRPIVLATVTFGIIALLYLVRPSEGPAWLIYFSPVVLEFIAGMVIAKFARRHSSLALGTMLIAIGAAGLLTLNLAYPDVLKIFTRGVPAAAVVLGFVLVEPHLNWGRYGKLIYLGEASYCLYLFHPMIAPLAPVVLAKIGLGNAAASVVASCVLAIVVTTAIFRFIDQPLMRQFSKVTRTLEKRVAPAT